MVTLTDSVSSGISVLKVFAKGHFCKTRISLIIYFKRIHNIGTHFTHLKDGVRFCIYRKPGV